MSTLTLRNVKGTPLTNTEVDTNFSNLNTDKLEKDGSTSMTGKLTTVTSSTSTASIRVPQGSADPSSPVAGDVWNNTSDLKFYTGAVTRVLTTLDGAQTLTNKILDAALVTNGLFFEGATVNDFETLLTVVDPTADRIVTIPDATTTMVGTNVAQTLTNKSINLASNTVSGTLAQFNTALSNANFATLAGAETLTNKTLTTPVISSISNTGSLTLPTSTDTLVGRATTDTLTNKSINLANNTLTTTSALLATAISDETGTGLVVFNGSPTITTPTIAQINASADFIVDAATDIILDADGADIILKDGGTEFGRFSQSSGQLVIASSSSATTALTMTGSDVNVNGDLTVNGNDIKSSTGATALTLNASDVTVAGDLTVTGNDIKSSTGAVAISLSGTDVTVSGNFTVSGTTTTVNSATLDVTDKNITVAKGNSTNAGANGAGITVEATTASNKTFQYDNGSDSWTSSENINIPTGKVYKINNVQISASNLSNSTTGSGAVVLATSPTLTTPALGTPSSGNLANCTFPTLNQNTTGSAATFTSTSQNSQFNSIGVGTAASATAGEIRATNEITAFFSDARLKNFHGTIPNALDKVVSLNGYYFTENEVAKSLGYNNDKMQVGVSAQEVEIVLPEAVAPAPIDAQYLTVKYEKLVPVLIEAIKALKLELDEVKNNCNCNK